MFGKLRNRGTRLIYLSMLLLTMSGAASMATPGPASAQTSNPLDDGVNCSNLVCRYLESSTIEYRPVVTVEQCSLGWSSRKATQEVTTTEVYEQGYWRYEYWTVIPDGWGGHELVYLGSSVNFETNYVETTVEKTECRPITGRPPQN